jgi:aquaporin Z
VTATAAEPAARRRAAGYLAHWREYAIEGTLLGLFMVSACGFTALLEHPASPAVRAIPDPFVRRFLTGCAMGATAIALIYSRWGMRSGAHMNPSTTLAFTRLGKVAPRDAIGYAAAQFVGGALGVALSGLLFGSLLAHERVRWAVTVPGPGGLLVAFAAELAIAFVLMTVILRVSNHPRFAAWTGICAGLLVAVYITFEAPLSGMSLNPARTLASALGAHEWTGLWLYFTAPPLGMLLAAEVYLRTRGPAAVFCAKLHHQNSEPCIFCEHRTAGA